MADTLHDLSLGHVTAALRGGRNRFREGLIIAEIRKFAIFWQNKLGKENGHVPIHLFAPHPRHGCPVPHDVGVVFVQAFLFPCFFRNSRTEPYSSSAGIQIQTISLASTTRPALLKKRWICIGDA
jgi:hypothetical protein